MIGIGDEVLVQEVIRIKETTRRDRLGRSFYLSQKGSTRGTE